MWHPGDKIYGKSVSQTFLPISSIFWFTWFVGVAQLDSEFLSEGIALFVAVYLLHLWEEENSRASMSPPSETFAEKNFYGQVFNWKFYFFNRYRSICVICYNLKKIYFCTICDDILSLIMVWLLVYYNNTGNCCLLSISFSTSFIFPKLVWLEVYKFYWSSQRISSWFHCFTYLFFLFHLCLLSSLLFLFFCFYFLDSLFLVFLFR